MNVKLKNKISSMFYDLFREQRKYYIDPVVKRIETIEGLINCLQGKHGSHIISGSNVLCSRCYEALGKIVSTNAEW